MSGNEPVRERLIVVGNGMVGLRFVEELLARAGDGYRTTVVGKEPQAAYNRLLLSSLLAGEISAADVRFRDAAWYADHGIELLLGTPAESIDVSGRLLRLADGRTLAFDRLVLATGSVKAKRIRVLLEAETERVAGDVAAEAVKLKDGRLLPADLVAVAIGIRPEAELARRSGIACDRGIVVDSHLETSCSGIYAIGECAEYRGVCYGLVEPGYTQARVLAARLAGGGEVYAGSVLATNLKVSGVNVFSTGQFLCREGTEEIVLSDPGLPAYKKLVIRRNADGQRLVGAVLFGDTMDGLWYQELIRSATPVGPMRTDLIFGRDFVEAAA